MKIKFKAEPHHQIGGLLRYFRGGHKFWRIYKIEGGYAFAQSIKNDVRGCC
jgi:hypothetical protein